MTKIKGISHITFICKDLEKTTEMFKTIFGAEEIYASGEKTFSLSKEKFFNIANVWIAIMEGKPIEKTYNHVAFQVSDDDLPLYEAKIRSLGLEILPGRQREKAEGNSLYFYDNDNHLFELHSGDLETRLKLYQG
jgi:fosfomycin resistance protein FosX